MNADSAQKNLSAAPFFLTTFRGNLLLRLTNPQILRFHRFLRVVLLVAAMPRCVAKVFVITR
jgi:hypothetical protein